MNTSIDLSTLDKLPIISWEYPRILVGIPIERAISYADTVFFNFLAIAAQGPAFIDSKYGRIDVVRNMMAMQLLDSTFTHILLLDVDHKHPSSIVQDFAKWTLLRPDIKVISGLNFRRKKPFDPVAGDVSNSERVVMTDWPRGLLKVDEVGAASMLIHREVFEQLQPPWFYNIYTEVWKNSWPGEDIGFSRKCKEAGIPIYVDTTISSPHATEALITEETFRNYVYEHPEEFSNVE